MLYITLTHPTGEHAPVSISGKTIALVFPRFKETLEAWGIKKGYNKVWVRHDLELLVAPTCSKSVPRAHQELQKLMTYRRVPHLTTKAGLVLLEPLRPEEVAEATGRSADVVPPTQDNHEGQ